MNHLQQRLASTLFGVPIVESPLAVQRVVRRVRGGYLNRWLIRAVVEEPAILHDRIHNRFYIHPTLVPKLREACGDQQLFRSSQEREGVAA